MATRKVIRPILTSFASNPPSATSQGATTIASTTSPSPKKSITFEDQTEQFETWASDEYDRKSIPVPKGIRLDQAMGFHRVHYVDEACHDAQELTATHEGGSTSSSGGNDGSPRKKKSTSKKSRKSPTATSLGASFTTTNNGGAPASWQTFGSLPMGVLDGF